MKRLIRNLLSTFGYEVHSTNLFASLRKSAAPWVHPGHFYSPYPNLEEIAGNEDHLFNKDAQIIDVDLEEQKQFKQLEEIANLYVTSPLTEDPSYERRYFMKNPNFVYSDGIILGAMLRLIKPKVLIEVGSGYSSAATLDINEMCFDNKIHLIFIEPYPQLLLSLMKPGDQERVTLISSRVQDLDVSLFDKLSERDILFIDSTHVAKVNSDVNFIFFEILPRLQRGVIIHFHDIFYPFQYPREWVYEGRAWHELYLVRVLLQRPSAYRIRFFQDFMFHKYRGFYEEHLPLCAKGSGASLWLEKI